MLALKYCFAILLLSGGVINWQAVHAEALQAPVYAVLAAAMVFVSDLPEGTTGRPRLTIEGILKICAAVSAFLAGWAWLTESIDQSLTVLNLIAVPIATPATETDILWAIGVGVLTSVVMFVSVILKVVIDWQRGDTPVQ